MIIMITTLCDLYYSLHMTNVPPTYLCDQIKGDHNNHIVASKKYVKDIKCDLWVSSSLDDCTLAEV